MLSIHEVTLRVGELFPGLRLLMTTPETNPFHEYRVGYYHSLCGTPIICGVGNSWEEALSDAQPYELPRSA